MSMCSLLIIPLCTLDPWVQEADFLHKFLWGGSMGTRSFSSFVWNFFFEIYFWHYFTEYTILSWQMFSYTILKILFRCLFTSSIGSTSIPNNTSKSIYLVRKNCVFLVDSFISVFTTWAYPGHSKWNKE